MMDDHKGEPTGQALSAEQVAQCEDLGRRLEELQAQARTHTTPDPMDAPRKLLDIEPGAGPTVTLPGELAPGVEPSASEVADLRRRLDEMTRQAEPAMMAEVKAMASKMDSRPGELAICPHGKPIGDDCGLCDLGPTKPMRRVTHAPAPGGTTTDALLESARYLAGRATDAPAEQARDLAAAAESLARGAAALIAATRGSDRQ